MATVVDGADAVRKAARDELRRGAHHIKVMAGGGVASPTDRIDSTQFSVEELEAAVQEAAAANRYVAAHAYTPESMTRALHAGVRTIEHGNLLDAATAKIFRETRAYLVMNLVTYWALRTEGHEHGLPAASWHKVGEVLDGGLHALELAHASGIKIGYGTDLLGGMHRHQSEEFVIRSEVQAPIDVIRSATVVGAEIVGLPGKLGTLAPGAFADLVAITRDPLADIAALADLTATLTSSRVAKRRVSRRLARSRPTTRGSVLTPLAWLVVTGSCRVAIAASELVGRGAPSNSDGWRRRLNSSATPTPGCGSQSADDSREALSPRRRRLASQLPGARIR